MGSFGPTASLDMDFEWCDKEQAAHPGRRGQNSAARSAAIGVNTVSCSKPVPVLMFNTEGRFRAGTPM